MLYIQEHMKMHIWPPAGHDMIIDKLPINGILIITYIAVFEPMYDELFFADSPNID